MKFKIDTVSMFQPQEFGLPEAKNIFEFVFSSEFLGLSHVFPLQFEVLRDFFEEYCPDCSKSKERYEDLVFFENGRCPSCNKTKIDLYNEGKIKFYNEIVGVAGTKSGKTTLAGGLIAPYILHKFLFRAHKVREILRIIPWETLLFVFVATSREQAQLTGWDHFSSTLKNSRWFRKYFDAIKKKCKDKNIDITDVLNESTTKIEFKFCRAICGCFHSNAYSLAGGTYYFVMIDELSRFERTNSRRSADEIVRVMKNNLYPVRAGFARLLNEGDSDVMDIYDGILAMVSAPLFEDDKSMRLLKGAEIEKRRFVFYRSTFEANPFADKSVLTADEEEDPERIMRDFEAIPSSLGEQYISDPSVLVRIATGTEKLVNWTVTEEPGPSVISSKLNMRIMLKFLNAKFDRSRMILIHADPGRVKDSFGIVIATWRGNTVDNYVFEINEIIDVSPILKPKAKVFQEVDFNSILEFIKKVSENFVIRAISYDRWNSVSHVQALRNMGIFVEDVNLTYQDFQVFRQDIYQQRIRFPKPEIDEWWIRPVHDLPPVSKALKEIYSLRDLGKKVDHPPGGSSDLAVCCVGAHRLFIKYILGVHKGNIFPQGTLAGGPHSFTGKVIRLSRFR